MIFHRNAAGETVKETRSFGSLCMPAPMGITGVLTHVFTPGMAVSRPFTAALTGGSSGGDNQVNSLETGNTPQFDRKNVSQTAAVRSLKGSTAHALWSIRNQSQVIV